MRKKSHITVARNVIKDLNLDSTIKHKITFYIGNIWPDCTPSFITKRHTIEETFSIFEKRLNNFILHYKQKRKMGFLSTIRLGIVLHYVADFFTYPHNSHYPGNIKDHCIYEEHLKHRMYSFLRNDESKLLVDKVKSMDSLEQISSYIKSNHDNYLKQNGNVDYDCQFSVLSCLSIVVSLFDILENNSKKVSVIY